MRDHKDLLIELEKKELEKYLKVKKDIEEIEEKLMGKEEKVSEQEIVEELGPKKSRIEQLVEKQRNVSEQIKEIAPSLKKIEENKQKSSKTEFNDVKSYIQKLNEIISDDKQDKKEYEKIINFLEEKYFEMNYKLKSQIHLNSKLKDKLSQVENLDARNQIDFENDMKEAEQSIFELNEKNMEREHSLSLKNQDLMYKLEDFLNQNRKLKQEKDSAIASSHEKQLEIQGLKDQISELNDRINNLKRSKESTALQHHSLNQQVENNLNQIESLKGELHTELDTHEKTQKINQLLKQENQILQEKIKDLNTHIVKLSESLIKAVRDSEQKDTYYPAIFESQNNTKEQEMEKLNIRIDSLELSEQLKLNQIKELIGEVNTLKNKLNLPDEPTIYDKIIEKTLNEN